MYIVHLLLILKLFTISAPLHRHHFFLMGCQIFLQFALEILIHDREFHYKMCSFITAGMASFY